MTPQGQPTVRVTDLITPRYFGVWDDMRSFRHAEYWLSGGRGSGKSTVAALRVVTALLRDPLANAVCYKKHRTEIRDSVFAECVKAIQRLGLSGLFRLSENPTLVTYRPTGQRILFRGLDDAGKSKGLAVTVGYVQVAWFEEYDQYNGQREIDTVLLSLERGGPRFQSVCTYNPPETRANWVNVESLKPSPSRLCLRTSYLDWRADWLGPGFIARAERVRAEDPTRYAHEYLGEVTGTGGEVFRNLDVRPITPEERGRFRRVRWGMDFGQADPTTLVGTNYDADGRTLYVFRSWSKRDAYNADVFAALAGNGLLSTPVIGDEGGGGKGVMKELRRMGARLLRDAYKPAGSVERGVRWLRELRKIVIDPETAPGAADEFSRYEWERLRDGTYRNEYPDRDNHFIDAARYANEADILGGSGSRLLV